MKSKSKIFLFFIFWGFSIFQVNFLWACENSHKWGEKEICSFLGGKEKEFPLDIDTYTFAGQKGEKITISLRSNPSGKYTGDRATLILTSRSKPFFKVDRSPLPNRISTVLPAKGEYFVYVIEQVGNKHQKSFKGRYCLALKSSQDAWKTFESAQYPSQAKNIITWTPERIEETLNKGAKKELSIAFMSRKDLQKVNLWITPELRPFIEIDPHVFKKIEANTPNEITLRLAVPSDAQLGHYEGTIHLRVGSRTYPETLKIKLDIVSVDRQMSFTPESFVYYSGKKQLKLEVFPKQISIRVANGQMENLKQWLEGNGLIKQPLEIEELGRKNIILVSLAEEVTSAQILELISMLNQTGFVIQATPIFGNENEKTLITDEFIVKFKDSYTTEQIENFIALKNVTIIKKDFLWPKCYLLGFTSASGSNTFEIAKEFYEAGMAEYAHPDFIIMTKPPWVTLLHEDFEGDFPKNGWEVYDANAADGLYYWGKVDNMSYPSQIDEFTEGSSKLWVAANHDGLSPDLHPNDDRVETYAPNMDSWMIFGPFDFTRSYWTYLEFLHEYESGKEFIDGYYDSPWVELLISTDKVNWFYPWKREDCQFLVSSSNLYTSAYHDVLFRQIRPLDCDQESLKNLWFALRFRSDGEIKGHPDREGERLLGAFVDDIKILGSNTEPAPPITKDPLSPMQWALKNTGQSGGVPGWDINILPAWEFLGNRAGVNPSDLGQSDVIVAVLDEGVDLNHEDLNLVPGYDATYDPNDPDSSNSQGGPNPWDAHGTACAGIIGAKKNNAGIVGVAPGVRIMPVRIAFSKRKGASWTFSASQAADGILWAVNNGARVLSNSWGGGAENDLLHEAIKEAKNRGAIVIFAAGNFGYAPPIYPARYEETIAVGAMSPCGEKKKGNPLDLQRENFSCDREVWSSNYGPELDVVAPGVLITTTDITGPDGYGRGDYINFFNGTSSATPHVAGIAALILAVNPQLNPDEVREILRRTARDIGERGRDDETGYGLVDAEAAVKKAHGWQTDLIVKSLSTVGEVFPTNTLEVKVSIANQGSDQAGPSAVGFFISLDNQLDNNDIFLGSFSLSEIPGQSEREVTGTIQIPAQVTPGSYFLIAQANYNGLLPERDEGNNQYVQLFTVINPPNIVAKPDLIDFGEVGLGRAKDKNLQIKNEVMGAGGTLKVIGILYEGDGAFQLDLTNYPSPTHPWILSNEQSIIIPVYFTPPDVGSFSGIITIRSNDPDESEIRITVTGTGIVSAPEIHVPGMLLFNDSNLQQSLFIENRGNMPLNWTISYDWYQNIPWPSWLTVTPQSGQAEAGSASSVNVSVRREGLAAGTYVYNFYIQSNDPNSPNIPVLIVFTTQGEPALYINPTTLEFGYTSTQANFRVINSEWNCADQLSWQIIGDLPSWLSVSPQSGSIASCGGSQTVTVQVKRSDLLPGDYSHTILVSSNSGSGSVLVKMNMPPPIIISPANVSLDLCGAEQVFSATGGIPPYNFELIGSAGEAVPDSLSLLDNGDGTFTLRIAPSHLSRDTNAVAVNSYINETTSVPNYLMPVSLYRYIPSDVSMVDVQQPVHTQCGANAVTLRVTDSIGQQSSANISFGGENTWSKTFGPWQANYIEETSDGGFIMAGLVSQIGYPYISDIRVTKLSQAGQIQWDKQVSMLGTQGISKILQTSDGGYIILGGNLVIKLDSTGNIEWKEFVYGAIVYGPMDQTIGETSFSEIRETSDGDFLLAGTMNIYIRNENRIQTGMMLVKLNSNGEGKWWKFYHQGPNSKSGILDFKLTPDGGLIAIGEVLEDMYSNPQILPMIIKFDSDGEILWNKRYDLSGYISMGFYSINLTSDGGYIIAGLGTVSSGGGGEGGTPPSGGIPIDGEGGWPPTEGNGGEAPYIPPTNQLIVIKTNSNGTIQWQKEYQNVNATWVGDIHSTNDDGYIIGLNDTSANQDAWIVKIDSSGEIVWQKAFGTADDYDALFCLQKTSDGYIAAGQTDSFTSGDFGDAWILKIGPDGKCSGCPNQ